MAIGLNGDTLSGFYSSGSVVQVITSSQNFATSISEIVFRDINSSSGVVWQTSITPKFLNSKILVIYKISAGIPADYSGFKILNKVNAGGTYSAIYEPQKVTNDGSPTEFGVGSSGSYNQCIIPVIHTPSYSLGDSLIYKIMAATYTPTTMTINLQRSGTGTNSGHSEVFIFEIAS